ncbi:hypothetical protein Hanom_Chr12g01155841 [Helianthus anomalus]
MNNVGCNLLVNECTNLYYYYYYCYFNNIIYLIILSTKVIYKTSKNSCLWVNHSNMLQNFSTKTILGKKFFGSTQLIHDKSCHF